MKKFLLIVILLMVMELISAPVSQTDIARAAGRWYEERTGNHESVVETFALEEQGEVVLYVFNMKNGFVITSADDRVKPVFGYGNEGKVDINNLPPQLEEILSWQKQEIRAGIAENEIPTAETSQEWTHLLSEEFIPQRNFRDVDPLLTVNWDQGQYYNALCPVDSEGPGGHVWAGCVATAMAQVMKYWEYPEMGSGSHSYYHWYYGTQSANFGATTYNWAGMPNSVYSPNTSVATLFYHLGVSVEMDYGVDGSGAYSDDARDALVDYFLYQNTATLLWKGDYTTTTWNTMLRGELDNGRPLFYRGQNYSSGHAFNLDGYQGTDYFHINWGWSSSYNGYFYLDDMTPGSHNYNLEQAAIFYLEPSLEPVVEVISPNGGESFALGDTMTITWNSEDISNNVNIMLYSGTSINNVIATQTLNDGSYNWGIPSNHDTGDLFRIKIIDYENNSIYDYSDGYFSIYDPIPGELESVVITISDAQANMGEEFSITVSTSELMSGWNLISYQFSFLYDEDIMNFTSYTGGDFMGNLLAYENIPGHIDVAYANAMPLNGSGNLVVLNFEGTNPGTSSLNIPDFRYNTYDIDNVVSGEVTILEYNPFEEVIITAGSGNTALGNTIEIPISTTELIAEMGVISFQFDLTFDNSLLSFDSYSLGEVPNMGNFIANESTPGVISVAYANVTPITGEGTLCNLSFVADASGTSDLVLSEFKYNSTYLFNLVNGSITISDVQYPDWIINPPDYEYSGSIWGIVLLDDVEVEVTTGMLGCFVGDECRGIAQASNGTIQYMEYFDRVLFLPEVYSNQTSGETLDFLYFDAETEGIYQVAESIDFVADMVVGDGNNPFVFHASTVTTIDITKAMVPGWNWFSLNVTGEDMTTNGVLASIGNNASNIKSQTQSAIYYPGPGWLGSLNTINNYTFYKLGVNNPATLEYTGIPVDIAEITYNLTAGWNWISYAPQVSENINYALTSLENGTNIKSQTQSAMYYAGPGWLGSLTTLQPLGGYMLKMGAPEQLNYPEPLATISQTTEIMPVDNSVNNNELRDIPNWSFYYPGFEYSGSIWGILILDDVEVDVTSGMLGCFVGDECRGIAQAGDSSIQYIDYFDHVLFLPMVYSDQTSGETLDFLYYDAETDEVYEVAETIEFVSDMVVGDGFEPFIFTVDTGANSNGEDQIAESRVVSCYPNPFNPEVNIAFYLQQTEMIDLTIYNIRGQKVRTLFTGVMSGGDHSCLWDGRDEKGIAQANGVYYYRLQTAGKTLSGKMVMLK